MSIRIIYYLLMNINEGKERIAPPPFYKIWLHETHLAPPSKLGEYSPCGHPNANTRRPSRSSSPFSSPACFHISHLLAILRSTWHRYGVLPSNTMSLRCFHSSHMASRQTACTILTLLLGRWSWPCLAHHSSPCAVRRVSCPTRAACPIIRCIIIIPVMQLDLCTVLNWYRVGY